MSKIDYKDETPPERGFYSGEDLESGGTCFSTESVTKFIVTLERRGAFRTNKPIEETRILDFGAGKTGRNSKYLRSLGYLVYSYDLFNGRDDADPWKDGDVSVWLPQKEEFDVVFTSFVLSVVQESTESNIIQTINQFSDRQIHLTRNYDIFETVKPALQRKDELVTKFFLDYYAYTKEEEMIERGDEIPDDVIWDFCKFGVKTKRGFQRVPLLLNKGFDRPIITQPQKVYSRS